MVNGGGHVEIGEQSERRRRRRYLPTSSDNGNREPANADNFRYSMNMKRINYCKEFNNYE